MDKVTHFNWTVPLDFIPSFVSHVLKRYIVQSHQTTQCLRISSTGTTYLDESSIVSKGAGSNITIGTIIGGWSVLCRKCMIVKFHLTNHSWAGIEYDTLHILLVPSFEGIVATS
jgi:hypothetical protein